MARYSRRNRRANSALPGYDNLGFDLGHPASRAQADIDEYGIDSDFGSTPHQGPYRSGPPPASVGWDPDHPATPDHLIEDYGLRGSIERKASKCLRIAEAQLGRRASAQDLEDLALRFMDLSNAQINRKLARLADDTVLQNAIGRDLEPGVDNAQSEVVSDFMSDEIIDDLGMDMMADDLMADDLMADEFYGDDMMADEEAGMMADHGMADLLAEEIESLKAANARLARQVRKLADDAVAKGTGLSKVEEELIEESEQPLAKSASRGMNRLANALADFFAEDVHSSDLSAEESILSSILAEVESEDVESSVEAGQNDPREFYTTSEEEDASMLAELDATMSSDMAEDHMGLDETAGDMDARLARIFQAADETAEEESAEDETAEEESAEEEKASSKKASLGVRPRVASRQNSVKTLGNISREASASDELSKLWESAPDVSKFFG